METLLAEAREAMERKYVLAAEGVDLEQLVQFVAEPHININKLTIFLISIYCHVYTNKEGLFMSPLGEQTRAPKKGGCCDDD